MHAGARVLGLPLLSSVMAINASWHDKHRMPKNATPQQRLTWHLDHAKACGCRALTAAMRAKLRGAVRLAKQKAQRKTRGR